MLDGRRVPPTSYEGTVDTNLLPQMLVQRVDVVTAGASAVYGSDAISGIVNFVLDTKYEGIKGVVQRGISQRGDNPSYRLGIAAGTSFADGRGHVVFSAEHFKSDGIDRKNARKGQSDNYLYLGAGTAEDPLRIYKDTRFANVARGGYVTSGPFAGQQFVDGQIAPFDPGQIIGNRGLAQGGDGAAATGNTVLVAALETYQAFGRLSYDVSDGITAFAQASYGHSRNHYNALENNFRFGIPIYSGNAFLPAAAQAQLTATNTPSFTMNRGHSRVEPQTIVDTRNQSISLTAGFQGELGGGWKWEAFYTHGDTKLKTERNESENAKFFAAVDAVDEGSFRTGVANGNVVCRVALTNPGLYPGCLPLNLFGESAADPAALAWVDGITRFSVRNKLDEFAANISGEPFDIWAGPISVNIGASYRKQSISQVSNADPAVARDYTGIRGISPTAARFVYTNVGSASGSYDVKEAYGEIVVPLAKDLSFARLLEFSGAGRYTKYSTTGGEYTWKLGLNYSPVDSVRFRGTISRDIRAPTLFDLFAGRFFNSTVFNDLHTGVTAVMPTYGGGNDQLRPEVGKTKTVGIVFQPQFLRNFNVSTDFYELKVTDAISTLTVNNIASRCEGSGGTDILCNRIDRPLPFSDGTAANFPRSIDVSPVNLASLTLRGFDFEASYGFDLGQSGKVSLRGVMSYVYDYISDTGIGAAPIDQAGLNIDANTAYPKVRATVNMAYDNDLLGIFLQGRYLSSTKLSDLTETVFDPVRAPAAFYADMTLTAKIGGQDGPVQPFLTITNLLDKKPPRVPATGNPGVTFPTTLALYDVVGRSLTAGIRFKF
ncbi:MAG: TonB-dependent receptor [Sphingobium sp.]